MEFWRCWNVFKKNGWRKNTWNSCLIEFLKSLEFMPVLGAIIISRIGLMCNFRTWFYFKNKLKKCPWLQLVLWHDFSFGSHANKISWLSCLFLGIIIWEQPGCVGAQIRAAGLLTAISTWELQQTSMTLFSCLHFMTFAPVVSSFLLSLLCIFGWCLGCSRPGPSQYWY